MSDDPNWEQTQSRLLQEIAEPVVALGMAQLGQALRLDLADALTRHAERLPHFLERARLPGVEAEAVLEYLLLTVGQVAQRVTDHDQPARTGTRLKKSTKMRTWKKRKRRQKKKE